MREGLKGDLEKVKSAEISLKDLVTQSESHASSWEDRAQRACSLGEEDLAREALARRSKCLHERQEFLARLSQVKMLRSQLEKELEEAVKEESQNTVMRVAEEIKAVQQELKQARTTENALLASILEEKIDALLDLGRQAWKVALDRRASCRERV